MVDVNFLIIAAGRSERIDSCPLRSTDHCLKCNIDSGKVTHQNVPHFTLID